MTTKDELNDILRGMPAHERAILAALDGRTPWELACAEQKRRAAMTLHRFSSEMINEIVSGRIDLPKAARDAGGE
ncbi:hypothetical protein J5226_03610 [Lysobacter sp. K5869]|uniref:hypothetical protein n=1 Tax=Lysobacter sp. K5869 TaxID=2820808 RepID=UPI001C060CEE|nr:hypothetical protein [Lysobacter sp. K5869]QWP77504.1 hypothetical protein J5226_03610 [Lysobacter sp. K5869]